MPPVALLARGDFAGLAPPVFEPPDPGGTDVVCDRDGGRFPAGIAIAEDAFAQLPHPLDYFIETPQRSLRADHKARAALMLSFNRKMPFERTRHALWQISLVTGLMKTFLPSVLVILLSAVVACGNDRTISPISPSDVLSDPRLAGEVLAQWSPYVGIHVTGEALDAYRDAVLALKAAGRLNGVRVELGRSLSPGDPTYRAISGTGVELLGLISNEFLFSPNIEQEIDRIFGAFPEIRHFQIGNEVTTILPSTGPTITIDQYMALFRLIYDHVQSRHRGRAILLTQATLGSGLHGPTELEAMVNLGLTEFDPSHVIIAINMYDLDHAGQFLGLLGGPLRRFRLWVTETGSRDPSLHMTWVRDQYPRLRNLVRAERVYWYVMWGGDSGPDTDFSLIKNPGRFPNYWKSPLFELLMATP